MWEGPLCPDPLKSARRNRGRKAPPTLLIGLARRVSFMSKVVGIIPARWGSTRFPGKPLHLIAGKPLLRHVWERCQKAASLDAVIIGTDDMRIAEAAFAWGAEVSLTSPRHRSGS